MDLRNFLVSQDYGGPIVCFSGSTFSPLFFSFYRTHAKKKHGYVCAIDLHKVPTAQAQAQLQSTFLGNSTHYYLRGLDELSSTAYAHWISFIQAYRGPNTILFFLASQKLKNEYKEWQIVTIPEKIDKSLFSLLLSYGDIGADNQFIKKLFGRSNYLSCDNAIIFTQYAGLIGKNSTLFFDLWVDAIVVPESSLFTFSQHFFEKNAKSFFATWSQMHDTFAQQFWISFWSDQLWRACTYAKLVRASKQLDAKKIGYRLPFSFLQRGWKKFESRELSSAHQFLYRIDHRLKHGGDPIALDLFYTKFFNNHFS